VFLVSVESFKHTVAVSVACQQAAKEQRSANKAIKAKRKDVSVFDYSGADDIY
jgi:hypothetical protein